MRECIAYIYQSLGKKREKVTLIALIKTAGPSCLSWPGIFYLACGLKPLWRSQHTLLNKINL